MSDSINTKLPLFCPCPTCNFYQKTDNKITKDGFYKTKNDRTPRQMYYCHGGKHRFSETMYSDLSNKQGSFKEYEMASKMESYRLSAEKIADVLEGTEADFPAKTQNTSFQQSRYRLQSLTSSPQSCPFSKYQP